MKILHLIQKPQNRGAETFAAQLANHQVNQGHEVLLVAIFAGSAELPWKQEILSLNGNTKNRFIDLKSWKSLARIIRAFEPDVLQANSGDTLKYAVLSKIIFKWKSPIVFRNASEVGKYLNSKSQKLFNSFLYRNIDYIISVSQASKNDILNHFAFLKGKISVIPIGIETPILSENLILEPEGVKHIIHVGGFTFEKNHSGLLKIFKEVLKNQSNVYLHLLGDGPLRKQIEEQILNEQLDQHVKMYGFVNNPLDYIQAGDLLVLPSIIEGLPGVILEAMYCKTPVIAYNVGGVSEVLDSHTGRLIEKENENKFVNAVVEALKDEDRVRIENANDLINSKFLNKKISKDFIRIYEKLSRV